MSKSHVPQKSQIQNPKARTGWSLWFRHWTSRAQRGFTLIEILLSVAIIIFVSATVSLAFVQIERSTALNRASDGLMSFFRLAREETLAAEGNNQWGVNVTATQALLFTGAAFPGTAEDTFVFPGGITAVAAFAGGGADVVFNRIDGTTVNTGTVTFTEPGGRTRMVTILGSGDVMVSAALPGQLGTRVTDTRHVHFALPFSLNNSTTMALTFSNPPNPNTVQTIGVQAQITNGQFLWDGTVDVNGSSQHLRIVSHAIGVATTDLAVVRDRIQNDKAVVIDVDGAIVGTYTAAGALTPGVGVTATVQ